MSSVACKPFIKLCKIAKPWLASEYTTVFFLGMWSGYFIMKPHWITLGGLLLLGLPPAISEYLDRKKQINSN